MWSLLERARLRAAQVHGQTLFHLSASGRLPPVAPCNGPTALRQPAASATACDGSSSPALDARVRALLQRTALSPSVILLPPGRDGDLGEIWIGFGHAVLLQPSNREELGALAERSHQILSNLECLSQPSDAEETVAVPPPRLYGAMQFDALARTSTACQSPGAASVNGDPWRGLPQAQFVLPRWLVCLRGPRYTLQLVVAAEQLLDPQTLHGELRSIESALQATDDSRTSAPDSSAVTISFDEAHHWRSLVLRALTHIAAGDLAKVVLARFQCMQHTAGRGFDWVSAICLLRQQYPACLRFALPLVGSNGAEALFMGATPELLVERRGLHVRCDALAGSRPMTADRPSDHSAVESLLCDDKERREHAFVVDSIRQRLQRHDAQVDVSEPQARILRNVVHLWTPLAATLTRPVHVLSLLADLHPTPAVCGVPQAAAAEFIARHEGWSRGFYAAPIGWLDAQGDGAFYVAIRSALLRGDRAWLFAGAGIVAGSNPDLELRETAAKLRPMLSALAAEPFEPPRMSA